MYNVYSFVLQHCFYRIIFCTLSISKCKISIIPDKPKILGGKIIIKNLKHSTVYEETVRQVEEQAKLKAEKYEEGELSDSSIEHRLTSSPSPEPSSGITFCI